MNARSRYQHILPDIASLQDTYLDEYYSDMTKTRKEQVLRGLVSNPYPGLRPFKASESIVFFGREEITSELTARLAGNRFLAVLGASGTGKSSLVRAGFVPRLRALPGKYGLWKTVICRPGKNPFGNLAIAICESGMAPDLKAEQICQMLSGSRYGYEEVCVHTGTHESHQILLIIDQFEELFRYRKENGVGGRNDAAVFVKMLIEASQKGSLNTYVMITMRSEYLGDCVQLPGLVEIINQGQFLVPRLKGEQLRNAIRIPAGFAGNTAEEGFAEKLIGEIGDQMDQLPVLQHALRRSFEHARDQAEREKKGTVVMRYTDYEAIGTMEDALDRHAKSIYEPMKPDQKKICQIIFQGLTNRSTDERGIRRPLPFKTLLGICAERLDLPATDDSLREEVVFVIDEFRRDSVNFIMPQAHVMLTDDLELDISHESLMRIWKDLIDWVDKETEDSKLLEELIGRNKTDLIQGAKLDAYEKWLERKKPGPCWALIYRPATLSEEEYLRQFADGLQLIKRSRKRKRQSTVLLAGLLMISFLSLGYIAYSTQRQNKQLESKNKEIKASNDSISSVNKLLSQARTDLQKTNENMQDALVILDSTVGQLNRTSAQLKDTIAEKNRLLASNRVKDDTNSSLLAMSEAQRRKLDSTGNALQLQYDRTRSLAQFAFAVKHAGKSLAITAIDSSRNPIKLQLALLSYWLLDTLNKGSVEGFQPQVYAAMYDALKSRKVTEDPKYFKRYPMRTGEDRLANGVIVNEGKKLVIYATAEENGYYEMTLPGGKGGRVSSGRSLGTVRASSDGRWLAFNTFSSFLLLKDLRGQQASRLIQPGDMIRCFQFSPDGLVLYIITVSGRLYPIDPEDPRVAGLPGIDLGTSIVELAVSNKYLYGLTSRGEVRQWDRSNLRLPVRPIPGSGKNQGRGTVIECKPDDSIVTWGNEDGEVYYSHSGSNQVEYMAKAGGAISAIAINRQGNLLAVAGYDKSVLVFRLPDLQAEEPLRLPGMENVATSLAFNDTDTSLVAFLRTGIVKVYPLSLNKLADLLIREAKRKLSSNECQLYVDPGIVNEQRRRICQEP